MLQLAATVAIAIVCSSIFIVASVIGTIVWVRVRHERVSMAIIDGQDRYTGNFTVTSLSREEGTALRQYGQLPYGRPNEWGLLASRESLIYSKADSRSTSPLLERARSLRRSLSLSRSRSKRQSQGQRSRPPSSLIPLAKTPEKQSMKAFPQRDDISISAVEGALELPTEMSPRQTPEREEETASADMTIRPISGPMASIHRREWSGNLFPLFEDEQSHAEMRRGSITTQTAGAMPEQPVPPPPPCAYPPNRYLLSRNDSTQFSSMSLETADSSILNDSRRTSVAMDVDFASPALPPCPTFAPFSANDVGRIEYDRKSFPMSNPAIPAWYHSSTTSPVLEGLRLEPTRGSPRRSLTAHSPGTERASPPPRRSESLSASQSRRDTSSMPYLDPNAAPQLTAVGNNTAYIPYANQMQRHSMYASQRKDADPFYGATINASGFTTTLQVPGRASLTSGGAPKPPLPSALKGANGPRKGHRRQNCVRISIHPPITFGGPAFSPMAEEPEELEEFDMRRSIVSNISHSNVSSLSASISTISGGRNSYQESQRGRLRVTDLSQTPDTSPTKKRQHGRLDSSDSIMGNSNHSKILPEIMTSLPPYSDGNLTQTPSPEKNFPVWMLLNQSNSPSTYENSSPSPRRSGVKGPRTQPGRPTRNSTHASVPLEENISESTYSGSPSHRHSRTTRPNSDIKAAARKSIDSPSRARADVVNTQGQTPNKEKINSGGSSQRQREQRQSLPSSGIHKPSNSYSGGIATIWEDKNLRRQAARRSTVSQVNGPAELQGEGTPKKVENKSSKMSRMSGHRKSKSEITTPSRKTVGLGIGAATPGSLYDGDGFLKE